MRKFLFLDIDGVLNMYGESSRTFMKPYGQHIEPHLVQRLHYIVEKVEGLEIVISSSWRSNMESLKEELESQGFKYWDIVVGRTPRLQWRGEEILKYLEDIADDFVYLVVDDEIADICGAYCDMIPLKNVVHTDSNEGMLDKDAKTIVRIFNDLISF